MTALAVMPPLSPSRSDVINSTDDILMGPPPTPKPDRQRLYVAMHDFPGDCTDVHLWPRHLFLPDLDSADGERLHPRIHSRRSNGDRSLEHSSMRRFQRLQRRRRAVEAARVSNAPSRAALRPRVEAGYLAQTTPTVVTPDTNNRVPETHYSLDMPFLDPEWCQEDANLLDNTPKGPMDITNCFSNFNLSFRPTTTKHAFLTPRSRRFIRASSLIVSLPQRN